MLSTRSTVIITGASAPYLTPFLLVALRQVLGLAQRQSRENVHVVIAFHAEDVLERIAHRLDRGARKQLVRAFGFLEADHVGRPVARELRHEIDAKANRV